MPPYRQIGSLPRKRHIAHRHEPGYRNEGIYYEEVVTTAGFGRAYSIVYHLRPPTRVRKVEAAGELKIAFADEPELRHHHLKSRHLKPVGDSITGRVPLMVNVDVTIARCRPAQPQTELYRNATADEVLFIHRGRGTLSSLFGVLPFKPYDYVVIPHCTTYRLDFEEGIQPDLLIVEAANNVVIPPRYLNPDGQLKLGAPFSERDLYGPRELLVIDREEDVPVLIKDGSRLTRYVLAQHPFDVVGWDGFVYPFTFNADDFEPITGTVHQPPPVQQKTREHGLDLQRASPSKRGPGDWPRKRRLELSSSVAGAWNVGTRNTATEQSRLVSHTAVVVVFALMVRMVTHD